MSVCNQHLCYDIFYDHTFIDFEFIKQQLFIYFFADDFYVFLFGRNQVLLDDRFIQPTQIKRLCGRRRFTLAHECAHQILFQLKNDENKVACQTSMQRKEHIRCVI